METPETLRIDDRRLDMLGESYRKHAYPNEVLKREGYPPITFEKFVRRIEQVRCRGLR